MFSLALLFGVFSAAVATSAPFYGPCRNLTTVKVDPKKWGGELFVNLHRFGEDYSCEYVWNRPIVVESGDVLLHNTWARTTNGIESINGLHASFVSDGVYEFFKFQADGTKIKFLANFLAFERDLLMINVCSDDAQFATGKDQVYVETSQATAPAEQACKIKQILEANEINPSELGLVNNCGCSNIAYDSRCKGYQPPTVNDFFGSC